MIVPAFDNPYKIQRGCFQNRVLFDPFTAKMDCDPKSKKAGVRCYQKVTGYLFHLTGHAEAIKTSTNKTFYINKKSAVKWLARHNEKTDAQLSPLSVRIGQLCAFEKKVEANVTNEMTQIFLNLRTGLNTKNLPGWSGGLLLRLLNFYMRWTGKDLDPEIETFSRELTMALDAMLIRLKEVQTLISSETDPTTLADWKTFLFAAEIEQALNLIEFLDDPEPKKLLQGKIDEVNQLRKALLKTIYYSTEGVQKEEEVSQEEKIDVISMIDQFIITWPREKIESWWLNRQDETKCASDSAEYLNEYKAVLGEVLEWQQKFYVNYSKINKLQDTVWGQQQKKELLENWKFQHEAICALLRLQYLDQDGDYDFWGIKGPKGEELLKSMSPEFQELFAVWKKVDAKATFVSDLLKK